ncbi:D-alanyl-D-alanine carboxypeptidase DacC [Candidatus Terasakiella magnetica]|uniref:serine-type D-Ala-D-Ala carboxypeptidase n=1 Tax=Candidatus Terasakiella magnetica TaxID=1867952 RepID=A0A1C3RD31_9PROT|nr:D-alanyl-D-alanine carboxypeptidase family protein [Candidatus Terasakiella magnetica]SCA55186.1 D-alanyl-D-alanine carboxypeptidase DacC [Candidatus Terasakiella magnetica]
MGLRSTFLTTAFAASLMASTSFAIDTTAREAFMVDVKTGHVLLEKDADVSMPPASMSKLMTLYLVFERLKDGRLTLDDKFTVSERAWRKGGAASGSSTMFLEPRQKVRVEDLIRGIIIQSGNDACIVVAEALAGSENNFAIEMTEKAAELGMENSTFANATGWPDPGQRMTARDLSILAKSLIEEYPEYYKFFAQKNFKYNGIRQSNRNPLLYKTMGADGLKTGHTSEAGYGLTSSAERKGRRLILVVNGLNSVRARSGESERLMEWGFREFNNYALFQKGEEVTRAELWLSDKQSVGLVIDQDVEVTLPRKSRRKMKVSVKYEGPIPAPVKQGQQLAKVVISAPDVKDIEIPLYAAEDAGRLGFVGRLGAALKSIIWGVTG